MESVKQAAQRSNGQSIAQNIPPDWNFKPMGEIGDVIRGASPRPKGDKRFYGGDIPRLMVEDVTRDGKYVFPTIDYLTKAGAAQSRHCKKGTLTIVCSGTVGIPSFLAVDACIHDGFLALVNINNGTSDDYLYHQLIALKQRLDNSATHGGVFTNLTTSGVKEFRIPLPPTKAEQIAIATALSDADSLIQSLEKLIAKKRLIKQVAMQELLRPKKVWKMVRLGDILESIIGGGTPSRANSSFWGNEIPWVTVKDFATFNPYYTQESITKNGLNRSATNLIPKGILITSTRMALGKAVIYNVDVAINQDLKALFPKNEVSSQYLFYWFQNNSKHIERLGSGSTVMGISLDGLKSIAFSKPPLNEQIGIVEVLTEMDKEIEILESKLQKHKLIKQGMMQNLLTGKIRLL